MTHPARKLSFKELSEGLRDAHAKGLVSETAGADGLRLYCYTRSCVYDRHWNDFTLMARGIVLDVERETLAATPFPKFFNVGEREQTIPDLAFETFEKVDGSLIIIFWHGGEWRTATKGSLTSDQAQWAAKRLAQCDTSQLTPGVTYLAEAVYPENRIVIHYDEPALVLLAAYAEDGAETGYGDLCEVAEVLGWKIAKRHSYAAVSDLLVRAKTLPATEEGFVLRFANGLRLKVKGDEYCRIHALISRVTPLATWEAIQAGDDLAALRKDLPEEFWADFDQITALLQGRLAGIVERASAEAKAVAHLSDKEVGLRLDAFPADVRSFIFPYRKNGGDLMANQKSRRAVFRSVRPTANQLAGYVPSYAINRVFDEAGA